RSRIGSNPQRSAEQALRQDLGFLSGYHQGQGIVGSCGAKRRGFRALFARVQGHARGLCHREFCLWSDRGKKAEKHRTKSLGACRKQTTPCPCEEQSERNPGLIFNARWDYPSPDAPPESTFGEKGKGHDVSCPCANAVRKFSLAGGFGGFSLL